MMASRIEGILFLKATDEETYKRKTRTTFIVGKKSGPAQAIYYFPYTNFSRRASKRCLSVIVCKFKVTIFISLSLLFLHATNHLQTQYVLPFDMPVKRAKSAITYLEKARKWSTLLILLTVVTSDLPRSPRSLFKQPYTFLFLFQNHPT